jgi:hypothetical protein
MYPTDYKGGEWPLPVDLAIESRSGLLMAMDLKCIGDTGKMNYDYIRLYKGHKPKYSEWNLNYLLVPESVNDSRIDPRQGAKNNLVFRFFAKMHKAWLGVRVEKRDILEELVYEFDVSNRLRKQFSKYVSMAKGSISDNPYWLSQLIDLDEQLGPTR